MEAGALEHHGDQILADVVQISLHRAHRGNTRRFDLFLHQSGTDQFHTRLHRPRGDQDLGITSGI